MLEMRSTMLAHYQARLFVAQSKSMEVVEMLSNWSAHADARQQKAASPQVLRSGGLQRHMA